MTLPSFSTLVPVMWFISTATLGIFSIGLLLLYFRLSEQFKKLHDEKTQDQKHARHKASALVDEAHARSMAIIKEAQDKAVTMFEELHITTEESRGAFKEALNNALIDQEEAYRHALAQMRDDTIKILNNVSNDIKQQTLSEVDTFRKTLQQEVLKIQDTVRTKVAQQYTAVEKEAQEYKIQLLNQVDNAIFDMVERVTAEIIGRSFSRKDHEQLVRQTLEEARKSLK